MLAAKVFTNGRSQAIRLPKTYRFKEKEVYVNKAAGVVMLIPKTNKWEAFMNAIDMFSSDFMEDGRPKEIKQKRENL